MKLKLKKGTLFICLVAISLLLSITFTIFNDNLHNSQILQDDFVVSFIGTLLVLSVGIITLIYSTIEKIKERTKEHVSKSNIDKSIISLFNTLKKDTWAVFIFLITVVLSIMFRDTNIPVMSYPEVIPLSKVELVYFIKNFTLFLSFFAVADIILCLFTLIKASNR